MMVFNKKFKQICANFKLSHFKVLGCTASLFIALSSTALNAAPNANTAPKNTKKMNDLVSWNHYFTSWQDGNCMDSGELTGAIIGWHPKTDRRMQNKKIPAKIQKHLISTKLGYEPEERLDYAHLNFKNVTYYGLPIDKVINEVYSAESSATTLVIAAPLSEVKAALTQNKVKFKKSTEPDMYGDYSQAKIKANPNKKNSTLIECY